MSALDWLEYYKFRVSLFITRIKCFWRGCDERNESGWNMPDDWNSPTWCKRCGAVNDVYGIETTPWPLIYSGDKFSQRLKDLFAWKE